MPGPLDRATARGLSTFTGSPRRLGRRRRIDGSAKHLALATSGDLLRPRSGRPSFAGGPGNQPAMRTPREEPRRARRPPFGHTAPNAPARRRPAASLRRQQYVYLPLHVRRNGTPTLLVGLHRLHRHTQPRGQCPLRQSQPAAAAGKLGAAHPPYNTTTTWYRNQSLLAKSLPLPRSPVGRAGNILWRVRGGVL